MATDCEHAKLRCLNHYEYFRKYLCEACGGVYMCECERELASTFLPHKTKQGSEYGTRKVYPVSGFAPNVCSECRGEPEEPFPKEYLGSQVKRYYWRELFKTYCENAAAWLASNGHEVQSLVEFKERFPDEHRRLEKEAKDFWTWTHRTNPKYGINERTERTFLAEVQIPIRRIEADHVSVQLEGTNKKLGQWLNGEGRPVPVEEVAREWYELQGYAVMHCEYELITVLVTTFFGDVLPKLGLPYGTYWRHKNEVEVAVQRLRDAASMVDLFDSLLDQSEKLRKRLGFADKETVAMARKALSSLPKGIVVTLVEWTIEDYWTRKNGWPDLLVVRGDQFLFVEVKSPKDRLRPEQMDWFQWIVEETDIPCEICRVEKRPPGDRLDLWGEGP